MTFGGGKFWVEKNREEEEGEEGAAAEEKEGESGAARVLVGGASGGRFIRGYGSRAMVA